MTKNSVVAKYLIDSLMPCGGIKTRTMFGGYGIYQHGVFFAIIVQDQLYFKVDEQTKSRYQSYDSTPFSYEGKNNKVVTMSYWLVPDEIIEDAQMLATWVKEAVLAAKRAKK